MKFKTTKKNMRENYYHIIGVGYCDLQHLLAYENPIAYSTRTEGWACDYYEVNGVLLSTGYAPLKSANTKLSYVDMDKYEKEAYRIRKTDLPWEQRKALANKLLYKMVEEAKVQE